jgi:nucleotide-binding universal stress UspA family protein
MIKSILVPVQGVASDGEALAAAAVVGKSFDAHLECLHVRTDPRLLVASTTAGMERGAGTGVFPAELLTALIDLDKSRAKRAHGNFEMFCKQSGMPTDPAATGLSASYREVEGDAGRDITRSARYNDLVVMAHDDLSSEIYWDAKSHVIVGCGRPILLGPSKARLSALDNVAIAWKDTAEAARALTAAMPILARAKKITVLSAREGTSRVEDVLRSAEHVAALLRRHALAVRAEHVPPDHKTLPESVIGRALGLKSDLLVMGAYGHGRLRETVFGGFTRHVLSGTDIPVLLAH